MIDSYFKVALNNLLKNKMFSLINIAGLATGILCFLLITLYVRYELSFDRHYQHAENIYRISLQVSPQDGTPDIRAATNSPNSVRISRRALRLSLMSGRPLSKADFISAIAASGSRLLSQRIS